MKKISPITKFLLALALIAISGRADQAQATWTYTPAYDIPYVVTAVNIAPSCNAGIDRTVTSPTTSVTIPVGGATASDSDGTITSTIWSYVTGPNAPQITGESTLTPTFMGSGTGSYTMRLTATDNQGLTCTDDMIFTISASNVAPVVNAGPDKANTLPTSSTSVTGTASDPDGTIVSTMWTRVSGPIVATIVSPASLSTSITGMSAVGTYVFRLTATDNQGATGSDDMQVVVGSVTVTGTLLISPNTCTIASNASTCTVTGATWTTSGATSPSVVDANTGSVLSTLANNASAMTVWVAYPSTTLNLKNATTILDTKSATAVCASGNSWNGSSCSRSVVNGMCASGHWSCSAGTSSNNATGTTSWTWDCDGLNGGLNAVCSENFSVGKPECSDDLDNDGDALIDTADPGCHTDNDATNPSSYVPSDPSERNNPKIIEIEQ